MIPVDLGPGSLTLLTVGLLVAFCMVAYLSLRRHIRRIDLPGPEESQNQDSPRAEGEHETTVTWSETSEN